MHAHLSFMHCEHDNKHYAYASSQFYYDRVFTSSMSYFHYFQTFRREQANAIVSNFLQVWLSLLVSIFILLQFFCSRSNLHCDYPQCCAIDGWKATELAGKPNKHSMPTRTHLSSLFCCVCDATLMKFTTKMRKWARRVFFQLNFFLTAADFLTTASMAWLKNFNFCLLLRHESAQLVHVLVPRKVLRKVFILFAHIIIIQFLLELICRKIFQHIENFVFCYPRGAVKQTFSVQECWFFVYWFIAASTKSYRPQRRLAKLVQMLPSTNHRPLPPSNNPETRPFHLYRCQAFAEWFPPDP